MFCHVLAQGNELTTNEGHRLSLVGDKGASLKNNLITIHFLYKIDVKISAAWVIMVNLELAFAILINSHPDL